MNIIDSAPFGPRGTQSAVVVQRIRDMIVSGDLPAGARIPERALIERFGFGRTPLREALKILNAEGMVEVIPNRGAVVTNLAISEVEDVLTLIVSLEGLAAPIACEKGTDLEFRMIEENHHKMVGCYESGNLLDYFHLNQLIHQQIVDCAHNRPLSRIYSAECTRIARQRFAGNQDFARWTRAVAEHGQILDALKQREGRLLKEILRAHHIGGWRIARASLEATQENNTE